VAKKPKPATAGEKIEMKRFGLTLDEVRHSGHKDDARRTDAAIRRERRRCFRIAMLYLDSKIGAGEMTARMHDGSNQ
jgi:hypothetical protein